MEANVLTEDLIALSIVLENVLYCTQISWSIVYI